MSARWLCELHQMWTSSDCPRCDDEQIAHLEEYAKAPACHNCKRTLAVGESAWASDWIVMGELPRMETRYHCDDCEADK